MFRSASIALAATLAFIVPSLAFPQMNDSVWIGDALASPALPLSSPVITEDALFFLTEEEIFRAVREVASSPPPGRATLFEWKGDRSRLSQIGISFFFSTARTEQASIDLAESATGQDLPDDARAFTLPALTMEPNGTVRGTILVIFLLDNMFLTWPTGAPSFNEAPWLTLASSVAHEVYGTVQSTLEAVASGDPKRIMDRRGGEVKAHEAGIAFLLRLKSRFPESTPEGRQLETELKRQKMNLDSWRDGE